MTGDFQFCQVALFPARQGAGIPDRQAPPVENGRSSETGRGLWISGLSGPDREPSVISRTAGIAAWWRPQRECRKMQVAESAGAVTGPPNRGPAAGTALRRWMSG